MQEPAITSNIAASDAAIVVSNLSWRYPGPARPALSDVSFRVATGSCFGLLGPNGAGKSTLFSLLSGIRRPRQGEIVIGGFDARTQLRQVRSVSGLAPQDFAFYPALTGAENLDFFAGAYGLETASWRRRRDEAVAVCELGEHLDKRAHAYSGGLKRRLNLAIALLHNPRVLYLDEPTVGIDARSRRTIVDAVAQIRRGGTTILYTSHYMEEVEALCDHVCIVNNGRIVSQGPIADYQQAGDPGLMHVRLVTTPGDVARTELAAAGAIWSTPQEFDAPATDAAAMSQWLGALARLGLSAAQVRYGESRLEKVYIDLISEDMSGAEEGPKRGPEQGRAA